MKRRFEPIRETIQYGDRVYARLCVNGEKIIEFFIDSVDDISSVVREVMRRVGKGLGLTNLYIRNITQGWSRERLYLVR